MNEYIKTLEEFNKTTNEFVQKLQSLVTSAVEAAASDVFKAFPQFVGISWAQYTPYFNDGDECIFGIGEVYYISDSDVLDNIVDGEKGGYDYEEDELVATSWSLKKSEHAAVLDMFESLLNDSEDFLKSAYGDHMEVTITKTEDGPKVSTTEYYHD